MKINYIYKIILFSFTIFYLLFFLLNKYPQLETQKLFIGERFPNIIVTLKGNLIASWGQKNVIIKKVS